MLKEMGNQNATPVTEEEKAANEAPGIPSIEENQFRNDHEEDPTLDHSNEKDEDDEGKEVNCVEDISDEIQETENPAYAITDEDIEDQEAKGSTLNPNAQVSHESHDLVPLDAKEDDHDLERIKEDNSMHVSEESNGKLCSSIDEITNQAPEEENLTPVMIETMSKIQEEKVIIISEPKISTSSKEEIDECEVSSQIESNDEEIIEPIEVVKDVMITPSLDAERYDLDLDHDANNRYSSSGSDDCDEEQEKFYEFAGKLNEMDDDARSSDHEPDFKDLEMVNNTKDDNNDEPAENSSSSSEEEEEEEEETEEVVSDFKDLEVDDPTRHQDHQNLEISVIETVIESHRTQSQINKSASFNFEFNNSVIKTEESDQTPLLYTKNTNNIAPLRSLSTPATARFDTPTLDDESSDQERTIDTVEVEYEHKPMTPLNETHQEKTQKIQEEAENGIEFLSQRRSRGQKRSKSSRNAGSYLFSSCICCSGVQELADP